MRKEEGKKSRKSAGLNVWQISAISPVTQFCLCISHLVSPSPRTAGDERAWARTGFLLRLLKAEFDSMPSKAYMVQMRCLTCSLFSSHCLLSSGLVSTVFNFLFSRRYKIALKPRLLAPALPCPCPSPALPLQPQAL